MLAALLSEIQSAATGSLGAAITAEASARGVTLVSTFAVETWWQERREVNRTSYPVVAVLWRGTPKTGVTQVSAGIRDAMHDVEVQWIHETTDATVMETHLLHLPGALLRWLDTFPTSSTTAGKTIHQIAPPDSQRIALKALPVNIRKGQGAAPATTYVYGITMTFSVRTREAI